MSAHRPLTQSDIDEAQVRLPRILGIAPRSYVPALLALACVAALALVLVVPGLRRHGTLLSVGSKPAGAAVLVDGAYRGSTPLELFIPSGSRTVAVSLPGYEESLTELEVRGRLVGSLFLPRRAALDAELKPAAPALRRAALASALAEHAAWALSGEPSSGYQHPLALSEALAARYAIPPYPPADERDALVQAGLRYAATGHAARDALRAAGIALASGGAATPVSSGAIMDGLLDLAAEHPEQLLALGRRLGERERLALEAQPLFAKAAARAARAAAQPDERVRVLGASAIGPVAFIGLSGGSVARERDGILPWVDTIGAYSLAATETTVAQFAAFLAARPYWAPDRREALIAQGLVTERYLEGFEDADPRLPITGVSLHAARAFAAWLSERAPSGYRVRVQGESQWAHAASAGPSADPVFLAEGRTGPLPASQAGANPAGIVGLLGNVWEWCDESYASEAGLGHGVAAEWPGSEFSVRGGSFANERRSVAVETRASFPPEHCSPYLGFRVSLEPIGANE